MGMSTRSCKVARADDRDQRDDPVAAIANRVFPEYVNCLERSGFREVDWRWRLAILARSVQLPVLKELEDPWVKRVRTFHEHCEAGDISPSDPEAAALDGAIWGACRIWNNRDPVVRAEVEARILAGETDEIVARRVGYPVDAVAAFERLFFNVRERIEATSYIMIFVIGPAVHLGLSPDDYPAIWKLLGYHLGPVALDLLMFTLPGPRSRPWPASIPLPENERARLVATCRLAILAKTLPAGTLTPAEVARVLGLHAALEGKAVEDRAVKSLAEGITTTLDPEVSSPAQNDHDPFDPVTESQSVVPRRGVPAWPAGPRVPDLEGARTRVA
jgi:hypothetical protein